MDAEDIEEPPWTTAEVAERAPADIDDPLLTRQVIYTQAQPGQAPAHALASVFDLARAIQVQERIAA